MEIKAYYTYVTPYEKNLDIPAESAMDLEKIQEFMTNEIKKNPFSGTPRITTVDPSIDNLVLTGFEYNGVFFGFWG